MTILYKDCGYFNEEIDDPYSPYPDECEDCYRYEICLRAKEKEDSRVNKSIDNKLYELLIEEYEEIELEVYDKKF